MPSTSTFSLLAIVASGAIGVQAVYDATLYYDNVYDDESGSLSQTACADWPRLQRFPTFGDVPTFYAIGGAPNIEGYNSSNCGSCYLFQYTPEGSDHALVATYTGLDVGGEAFVGTQTLMDYLTNGRAEELGEITVEVSEWDPHECSL